jgi:hypothetical protein
LASTLEDRSETGCYCSEATASSWGGMALAFIPHH